MFDYLKSQVDRKSNSKNPFWKFLVFLKFKVYSPLRRVFVTDDTYNILLKEQKAIYFPVPKVACTSIKYALTDALKIKIPDRPDGIHMVKFRGVNKNKLSVYEEYFKFGFVRNPWDRLASCYFNRIKQEPITDFRYKEGVARGFIPYKKFYTGMSFKEFVKAIATIPDNKSNPHFKSQYTFLTNKKDELIVNYIGKFETLNKDWNYICKKIGIKNCKLGHKMKSGKSRNYKQYYDEETKAIVAKRFAKDIKMFNYKF